MGNTPTDAELWQLHMQQPGQHKDPIDFARAVLAKWGTPAPVGVEPVAETLAVHESGEIGYCDFFKALPIGTKLYTAEVPAMGRVPQGLEPEFDQFLSDVMTAAGLVTHGKQCKQLGERLGAAVMKLRAHGIKGGQHGAE